MSKHEEEMKLSIEHLDELKKAFDKAYCEGSHEQYINALIELRNGYQVAFGETYELMMHVLLKHVDASLLEAI